MRFPLACLVLVTALPAFAQGTESHWYLDVHRFTPSLTGYFNGTSDGQPMDVDLQGDLGLEKSSTKIGFGAAYEGTRFGLEISRDEQDYAGLATMHRNVTINGQTFNANAVVTSSFKATNNNLNWTIRALKWPQFWIGLDLGARATQVQLDASAVEPFTGVNATADYKTTLPIPQIGPSLGFTGLNGRLVGRASYHLLEYKGCSYGHTGIDLRVFPISWLGIMAFYDNEHFRVPQGSVASNLDALLDRNGMGFGVVARF
jgi:hypothetical protein